MCFICTVSVTQFNFSNGIENVLFIYFTIVSFMQWFRFFPSEHFLEGSGSIKSVTPDFELMDLNWV